MRAWLAAVSVLLAGCGVIEPPPVDAGRPCALDSECVPDGCCGGGQGAVHVSERPDCSTVRCDGSCPAGEVRCGCGLPVCRDSRCVVAVAADPRCE